jgi:hypothetical protein
MVDRAIQEVTGAVKATIGVGGAEDEAGGGTFRGQMLNKQAASERFMLYARTLESGGLSDCFRKIYQRIYQFKPYESVERIIGKERFMNFEFITPEDLESVATMSPMGVMTLESKGTELIQMDQFAQRWMGRPWLKEWDLARKIWLTINKSDPDTVIFSPEEMKQFNEMRRTLMAGMPGPSELQVEGGGEEPGSIEAQFEQPPVGQSPGFPVGGEMGPNAGNMGRV